MFSTGMLATRFAAMARVVVMCVGGAGLGTIGSAGAAHAADLTWEVANPFRLYKQQKSFALHESAYKAVLGGSPGGDVPSDIVQRIERCLNDPDTSNPATRTACTNLARTGGFERRLGWASATIDDTCFNRTDRPRRYTTTCLREGQGTPENFVRPQSHAVSVGLAPERLAEASGTCSWRWRPRAGGEWGAPVAQPCAQKVVIRNVPYSTVDAESGIEVEATLPDGRTLAAPIAVEDLFIVALGDSFASGEGNPDRPVTFSETRGLDYRNQFVSRVPREDSSARRGDADFDPYVLPRRLMKDEEADRLYPLDSREFLEAFWERSAVWLGPDCHRSQYAFPHRVGLQLALENRHRAVTLVNLGCSGAEVVDGLFTGMAAREHYDRSRNRTKEVPSQFDQLTALICEGAARRPASYDFKVFAPGRTEPRDERVTMRWCPPDQRRRDIDLVLLSIGGNDVGFGALAAYTFLDSVGDIARVARIQERELRFGPNIANVYLAALDGRLDAVRRALDTGFGVDRSKVVHVSYEPVANDENQRLCGRDPNRATYGMDVHARFKYDARRVGEVSEFLDRLLERLQCISTGSGASCRGRPPAGGGTGFTLVVEHQPEFLRRGICARDPGSDIQAEVPRIRFGTTDFSPYSPGDYRPYAHHRRLFRTPNDAFMTANEHKGGETPLFDILQPAVAALYSGAFHPNAEAHALVADHVMPHIRRLLAPHDAAQADQPDAAQADKQ